MKIALTSVMVDDQAKALTFYTEKLGFLKKQDLDMGEGRWLTLVSPEDPEGPELLLEPAQFSAARDYQKALFEAGLPLTAFQVEDIKAVYHEMKSSGVDFQTRPTKAGTVTIAVFDDTCGNLIQLYEL